MTERARFATASPGDKELLQRPPEAEHLLSRGALPADSLRKAQGWTELSDRSPQGVWASGAPTAAAGEAGWRAAVVEARAAGRPVAAQAGLVLVVWAGQPKLAEPYPKRSPSGAPTSP
jgi:hypothetical protein